MASRGSRPVWQTTVAAGIGGLVVGGLTLSVQGALPGSSNRLANSGAVWVVGAFVAGAITRDNGWRTWLAGTAVLVGAVGGYYGSMVVFEHRGVGRAVLAGPIGWSAVALASGPVFAIAGSWWRDDRLGRRVGSLCLLGGVFLAEGGYLLASHRPVGEAVVVASVGVLIPLALGRSARERLYGVAAVIPAAMLGFGGYAVLSVVLDFAFTRRR